MRRILITVVVTVAVIFMGVGWVAPVALSFYAARKVPPVARVVPTDLKDTSVSQAPGTKLSSFGYQFEVPWSDLDETQTKLYPADKPVKTAVPLTFRSGLRLRANTIPAHEWAKESYPEVRAVPRVVAANFGYEAVRSDYSIAKSIYEFVPNRIMLLAPADTGIFNIQNQEFKGFQQGDTQVRQAKLEFDLYSDDGSVEFMFFEKGKNAVGVTQPEMNRIIQTLRKTAPDTATAPRCAKVREGRASRPPTGRGCPLLHDPYLLESRFLPFKS